MASPFRYSVGKSQLAGVRAHYEQLVQLMDAPADYWKAQTPIPFRPVESFEMDESGGRITGMTFSPETRPEHVHTLLVLMAARMPGLSLQIDMEGAPDLTGLRLVHGKLEARRADGAWSAVPHHSSLIGKK